MHKNTTSNTQREGQFSHIVTLDFIRHGEPEGGTMYRGSQDDPLSDTGWQQLHSSANYAMLQGAKWQEIVTSPMQRCQAFAKQLSQQLNIPLTKEPSLRELCFGDLEGLTPKDAWEQYPTLLAAMWNNPEAHTPPNGEPFGQFCDRVELCLRRIIQHQFTQSNEHPPHLLLVVHGGVIRAMLHRLFAIPAKATFQFDVPFAAITRITAYADDETFTVSLKHMNGVLPNQNKNPDSGSLAPC